MILPPLFDDGRLDPNFRIVCISLISLSFAFIWAVVEANKGMIPSIGSLAGVGGILEYNTAKVFFATFFLTVGLFPVFFYLDRGAAVCWGWVRELYDDEGDA